MERGREYVIALAGNPNVGKSTVFNALTGMHQHTGNWPGKTVVSAEGYCRGKNHNYRLVDLPGTYSLMAHSAEEEVARNFLCFDEPDAVIVVCDATCLERNLNLVLQTLEITAKVVVCVNLMDEAKRKGIAVDCSRLSKELGVPVVATVARQKRSLGRLLAAVEEVIAGKGSGAVRRVRYPRLLEEAIALIQPHAAEKCGALLDSRWLSLKLLEEDTSLNETIDARLGASFLSDAPFLHGLQEARKQLAAMGVDADGVRDLVVSALVKTAETVAATVVSYGKKSYDHRDRKIDTVLTSRWGGYPLMLALLALIFWITISGANVPSQILSNVFFWGQDRLSEFFYWLGTPLWLKGLLVDGLYRVLAWVVSVMLPPMAIFFPLFTLLEDAGYLPRIAYNLDKPFQRCCACGKQALTMCMGFGCNAVGVTGCRIIDSPRERLLAILTNNFVPCNGRFPTLIALITMFFLGSGGGFGASLLAAGLLTTVIVAGVGMTFAMTKLLSKTLLKGVPSSFTLELPPYRRPQILKVVVRSLWDRTLFVLGRAVVVAAPAGLVIWLMANISVGDASLLQHCAAFLDPFARLLGLDGVILLAFLLALPANEIVVPIIIMAYLAQGNLVAMDSLTELKALFVANGWTWATAVSMMLFCLFHWPCSTTLLTIKKETGSWRWTALAFALPTAVGLTACFLFTGIVKLFL